MGGLFPSAAPRLRRLAAEMEPLLNSGGYYAFDAFESFYAELEQAAIGARAQEALAGAEERVGRGLFAVVGTLEKHLDAERIEISGEDAALLRSAFLDWAESLEALPRRQIQWDVAG